MLGNFLGGQELATAGSSSIGVSRPGFEPARHTAGLRATSTPRAVEVVQVGEAAALYQLASKMHLRAGFSKQRA